MLKLSWSWESCPVLNLLNRDDPRTSVALLNERKRLIVATPELTISISLLGEAVPIPKSPAVVSVIFVLPSGWNAMSASPVTIVDAESALPVQLPLLPDSRAISVYIIYESFDTTYCLVSVC